MAEFGRVPPSELTTTSLTPGFYLNVYAERLTAEQKEEIEAGLEDGTPQVQIALQMGLPVERIHNYMYHQRQQRQKELPQSRPKPEFELAHDLWREGRTIQEIADTYEYSFRRMYGVIEHYRRRFGWFANRHRRTKLPRT